MRWWRWRVARCRNNIIPRLGDSSRSRLVFCSAAFVTSQPCLCDNSMTRGGGFETKLFRGRPPTFVFCQYVNMAWTSVICRQIMSQRFGNLTKLFRGEGGCATKSPRTAPQHDRKRVTAIVMDSGPPAPPPQRAAFEFCFVLFHKVRWEQPSREAGILSQFCCKLFQYLYAKNCRNIMWFDKVIYIEIYVEIGLSTHTSYSSV